MYACIYLPEADDSEGARLRVCVEAFSPHVAQPAPGLILFDLRGLGRLYGEPRRVGQAVAARVRQIRDDARVAVAANPFAAKAAARGFPGLTVILPGEEAARLGELPLSLLEPSDSLSETLRVWGIRTFGQLSKLPEGGVAERLGREGIELHRRARGIAQQPLVPEVEPVLFEAAIDLEHPLELLEPLSFLLSRLLHDVCSKLGSHGFAANEIAVQLKLEGGADFVRVLRLPYAGRDAGAFLKLMQIDLAAHPPDAPILRVAVAAHPVAPRRVQTGLFVPQAPEAEKLELTLARLKGVVGEENVGCVKLPDTHRPGAFRMIPFTICEGCEPLGGAVAEPRLSIRIFRPPLSACVAVVDGRPRHLSARGIRGEIAVAAGPWRTSGDWWRQDFWARDEWDVALASGELYRVYRTNTADPQWFVDGNYD